MANLSNEFAIPLKVVTARCQHLKASFKGIFNKIESKAIKYKNDDKKISSLVTWDWTPNRPATQNRGNVAACGCRLN